ncbi:hypothetical protein LINPERHAP2_LOCUS14189 [Linum perenne]
MTLTPELPICNVSPRSWLLSNGHNHSLAAGKADYWLGLLRLLFVDRGGFVKASRYVDHQC